MRHPNTMELSKKDLDYLNRVLNLAIVGLDNATINNQMSEEFIDLKELQVRIQEEQNDSD
jgi:hypothetical protein